MGEPESALRIEDVVAGYGTGNVLRGVHLTVRPGEVVATIGRNGVGKTTLIRTIMGLLSIRRGKVLLDGRNISPLRPHERAALGIGYVPQGREIFPELTVQENLGMGETINKRKKRARYDLVYEHFPVLRRRRRQLAGTLSGGEQQMLAIGRALVGDPRILLLDEPSVGIQPSIIKEISATLRRLKDEEGLTILLVEQNVALIEELSDRAYAMDKGRIVADLSRDDTRNRELLTRHLAV